MNKIFLILLLFIASCATLQANEKFAQKQKYVLGTEDIPLYEGLKALDSKNVVYDSADGRIIDANYFSDHTNVDKVKQFYSQTLAQLGWKKKNNQYVREGESLQIRITAKGGITFVKFKIAPAF